VRRYRVTIDGRTYEVEIDDPRARPVRALVSGEVFLVEVEDSRRSPVVSRQSTIASRHAQGDREPGRTVDSHESESSVDSEESAVRNRQSADSRRSGEAVSGQHDLTAPIPGTVVSVVARVGQVVQRGDELLTLEAMKMFNVIRSPRAGTVAEVYAAEGKRVVYGEPLVTIALKI